MTGRIWNAVGIMLVLGSAACGGGAPQSGRGQAASSSAGQAASAAQSPAASGPIDVCGIVTADDATGVLGTLAPQPKIVTDKAGFGTYTCLYIGPALGGEGAQTRFARLTVSAGRGKDAADIMEMDAERRHATIDVSGAGDAARRSENGSFVWAKKGGVECTAEIAVGLPPGLTGDAAAGKLAALCGKVFGAAR